MTTRAEGHDAHAARETAKHELDAPTSAALQYTRLFDMVTGITIAEQVWRNQDGRVIVVRKSRKAANR